MRQPASQLTTSLSRSIRGYTHVADFQVLIRRIREQEQVINLIVTKIPHLKEEIDNLGFIDPHPANTYRKKDIGRDKEDTVEREVQGQTVVLGDEERDIDFVNTSIRSAGDELMRSERSPSRLQQDTGTTMGRPFSVTNVSENISGGHGYDEKSDTPMRGMDMTYSFQGDHPSTMMGPPPPQRNYPWSAENHAAQPLHSDSSHLADEIGLFGQGILMNDEIFDEQMGLSMDQMFDNMTGNNLSGMAMSDQREGSVQGKSRAHRRLSVL